VGHVTCMGKVRNAYKILVGKPEGKKPFRDQGNGKTILKQIIKKGVQAWTGFTWLRTGSSGRLL